MNQPYQGAYSRRRFSNFEVGGIETDINLDNFKTLSVHWDPSMGNVTGSGNFNANGSGFGLATAAPGDTITLTAYPEKGYHFVKWAGGILNTKNTNNPIDIKMTTSVEVTAVFAKDQEDHQTPPPGEKPPVGPIGGEGGEGGGNGGNYTSGSHSESMMDKAVPFIKKWWWAILIVAYIIYKEMKGDK